MEIITARCSEFRHREFILRADETVVRDVYLTNAAQTVEAMVAAGEVFQPDETFQFGWMTAKIVAEGSNLAFVEPDMQSFPIKWVPGLTETLRTQILQLFMLDSVSLRSEMEIPSIQESLIVCKRYDQSNFFMSRSVHENPTDSGWFVGCMGGRHDHNNPDNLKCISLYEAFLNQRGIQGFVSFPVGSMIVSSKKEGISIAKDGQNLDIVSGSFLDSWIDKNRER
jgi:hypothetical protein